MEKKVDLLIIGGGCAGLSLAGRLAHSSSKIHTLVVEPRLSYEHDKTWCFWKGQGSKQDHLPLREWKTLEVACPGERVLVDYSDQPYQMLRSIDFYKDKLEQLRNSQCVELRLGDQALASLKTQSDGWRTETTDGIIISHYIVDTRPPASSKGEAPILWQTFVGYEVESKLDTFDASTAQLMDFAEADKREVVFIYTLPTGKKSALIELTVIAKERPSFEFLAQRLDRKLREKYGAKSLSIIRREHGAIPMGIASVGESADPTYCYAGVAAGSSRPSSGYTFCRIQRWAQACGDALLSGGYPVSPGPDSKLVQFMDSIFLRVLRRQPQRAPELFLRMFRDVPPSRLLRFLGDSPTLLDSLTLMAALPKIPFLKEVFRPLRDKSQPSSEVSCFP